MSQACFIDGLLASSIDAPDLLASICLHVPCRALRRRPPLDVESRHTLYCYNDPFLSCLRWFNYYHDLFDFNSSLNAFRSHALSFQPSS